MDGGVTGCEQTAVQRLSATIAVILAVSAAVTVSGQHDFIAAPVTVSPMPRLTALDSRDTSTGDLRLGTWLAEL